MFIVKLSIHTELKTFKILSLREGVDHTHFHAPGLRCVSFFGQTLGMFDLRAPGSYFRRSRVCMCMRATK